MLENFDLYCASIINESETKKRDACYYKVKKKFKVWPSAQEKD